MKISTKLIFLCAMAVLASILQAGISQYFHAKTRAAIDNLSDSSLASFISFTDIHAELSEVRARTVAIAFNRNLSKDAVVAEIGFIRQHIEAAGKQFKQYESVAALPEDKRLAVEQTKAWLAYVAGVEPIMDAVKAGDYATAEKAWTNNTPKREALTAAFAEEIKFNIGDADINRKASGDAIATLDRATIGLGVVLALLLVIVGFLVTRSITRPLGTLREGITRIGNSLDFTYRVPSSGKDEIADTLHSFNAMIDTLQASIRQLQTVGMALNGNGQEISTASGQLSHAAESVSDSASTMSAGVEQLTMSVADVADRTDRANSISREAGSLASEGAVVIDTTIRRINEIAEHVRASAVQIDSLKNRAASIGTVVDMIRGIADQTNLLALNAAIEAARAGEQGRGFAVVADEVRSLAERTSSSTREIAQTVQAIQAESNSTVEVMQGALTQVGLGVREAQAANEAISRIRDSSDAVVEQVQEISISMREQSTASNSMAQQVERVAQMAEEFSATAATTAASSVRMSELGREFDQVLSHYKV